MRCVPWYRDWAAWLWAHALAVVLLFPWDAFAQTSSSCCTPQEWELIGVTAEQILLVWSWGFGSVILMWSLGYAVGVALGLLKKL